MGKNTLAPGFRFHPTDVELIMYYLKRKILGKKLSVNPIAEVDIYKYAPWDLPDMSCLKTGDLKWHFYCPISKKYNRGDRVSRATVYGYWKATGKDRSVKHNDEVVGMIKTLVFHQGKAPHGERTDWVMHEYRLEEKKLADKGIVQDSYMLYVLFKKDGVGPRNGAQYGAPFKEEDWNDDDDDEANLPGTGSLCSTSIVAVASGSSVPESLCVVPTVDSSAVYTLPLVGHTKDDVNCTTDADAYTSPTCVDTPEAPMVVVAGSVPAPLEAPQLALVPQDQEPNDNNIISMLEVFTEDDDQMTGNFTNSFVEAPKVSEEDDILSMLAAFTEVDDSNNWRL
ncbi:NAC domain-containing protein 17 [Hibiscus syriacus]|uniref:NAC domain-containing protein 17 n=1 Tax=Hibiscus syriacus TaxID=106335 RepID=A0A6A2ZQQ4_HIBSY|nr:NAC domain-containing protein 82-like isoform X1 [Hibiscus syriacus]XP_039011798.1 NAC domain-containing protein 82-like isoform X1 [Hibiscus syriacus]KAE8694123.1 NAC domain-containing protein 17 [Hibiscus syriacus]